MGEKAGKNHPPFYKFMTASTAEIVLSNGTLRWSQPTAFNDPFDLQFDLAMPEIDEQLREETQTKLFESMTGVGPADSRSRLGRMALFFSQRLAATGQTLTREDFDRDMAGVFEKAVERGGPLVAQLQSDLRDHLKSMKLLCLTDRVDSVQQWSHYAQDHRGVVLSFVTPKGINSPWPEARRVDYVDEMPLLLTRTEFSDFNSGRDILDHIRVLDRIILTKAKEWANESEWRITSGFGRDATAPYEDIPFHPRELGAVILGCRMDGAAKERITRLTTERFPHAEILQASKAKREFRVVIEKAT